MDIETLIGQVAFPIVVALFFMLQMNDTLKQLGGTIQNNTMAIVRLCDKMNEKPPIGGTVVGT